MKELHSIVHGRVQGVGFRRLILHYAEKYLLRGITRNLSDGTVEICAQGSQKSLELFLQDLKQHKGAPQIKSIETSYKEAVKKFEDFRIIY
ncbi:MAG: acylphosphatase [Chlamydiales bacterium]